MQSAGRPLPPPGSANQRQSSVHLSRLVPQSQMPSKCHWQGPAPQFKPGHGELGLCSFSPGPQRLGLGPSEVTAWEAALAPCPPTEAIFGVSQLPADTELRPTLRSCPDQFYQALSPIPSSVCPFIVLVRSSDKHLPAPRME